MMGFSVSKSAHQDETKVLNLRWL